MRQAIEPQDRVDRGDPRDTVEIVGNIEAITEGPLGLFLDGSRRNLHVTVAIVTATAFDRYLKERLKDGAFAREYRKARREIDATDDLVRALDRARVLTQVSKAELARRIGAKPEMVRRLLTAAGANPTMGTVLKITTALGYHLELVPDRGSRSVRSQRAARIAHKR